MRRVLGKRDADTWVEASGFVTRLLHDDDEGARHQRFVLDVGNGRTVLVAHNLDVAARIPLGLGDRVRVRGLYDWNLLGGTVHWTHRDPRGRDEGGFVEYRREIYR